MGLSETAGLPNWQMFRQLRLFYFQEDDTMTIGNLRKAFRFKGTLRVSMERGTGFTRDFSTDGVYVITPVRFAVGETIAFNLNLDNEPNEDQIPVRCNGKILRVEQHEKLFGIAIAMDTYISHCSTSCGHSR